MFPDRKPYPAHPAYIPGIGGTALLLALSLTQAWTQTTVNTMSPCEKAQGFESQFDGTVESFRSRFVDYARGNNTNSYLSPSWSVSQADSAVHAPDRTIDTRSRQTYGDFDWRMDYRNSGADKI